jgi:protein-tyrosine-phosphatase
MLVHFVCEGNTFRSRLAEAYLNSKKIPNFKATSSGTEAKLGKNGEITWYAQRILFNNSLLPFTNKSWRQTTKSDLEKANMVVFIGKDNFNKVMSKFKVKPQKYIIWNIKDLWEYNLFSEKEEIKSDINKIKITEEIFEQIKANVDSLIQKYH